MAGTLPVIRCLQRKEIYGTLLSVFNFEVESSAFLYYQLITYVNPT